MKWCEHCRKTDHDDAECWSTRAVPTPRPDPMQGKTLADLMPAGHASTIARRIFEAYVRSRVIGRGRLV